LWCFDRVIQQAGAFSLVNKVLKLWYGNGPATVSLQLLITILNRPASPV